MNDRMILAALLWVFVAAGLYACRRQSPLHMMVIALGLCGIVGSFFPVAASFIEPLTWRNVSGIPERVLLSAQGNYLAFGFGLLAATLLAAWLGWLKRVQRPDEPSRFQRHRDQLIVPVLFGTGSVLYAVWIAKVGLGVITDKSDFGAKYLSSQGLGAFSSGLRMMILACLWAEVSLRGSRRYFYRGAAVAIAVWSIAFMSVRGNLVMLALGYLSIYCWSRRVELRRLRPSLVIAGLVLFVGLESFARMRGQLDHGVGQAFQLIIDQAEMTLANVVGGSDLAHPFMTTLEVQNAKVPGELMGRSYLNGLLAIVPRSIFPERPLSLSESFAREFYPYFSEVGGGTNFSIVAEAWWNFGSLAGPFLVAFFLGLILCNIEKRRETAPHGVVARLAPFVLYLVVILEGSEFAVLAKQTVTLAMVVLIPWIATLLLWESRRRGPANTGLHAHSSKCGV